MNQKIEFQITWWGSNVNSPYPSRRTIYYYIYSDTSDIRNIDVDTLYKYAKPATVPGNLPRTLVPAWLRSLNDVATDIISNHPRTVMLIDNGTLNISVKGGRRLFILTTTTTTTKTISIRMYQFMPTYRIINVKCNDEYDLCWHIAQNIANKMIMFAIELAKLRFFYRIYTGKYNIIKL